jgi:hypothetical protein
VKRKKYFDSEGALESIWQHADRDGIWHGDAASLAAEFDVTENDAHSALSDLCDRRIIEKVYIRTTTRQEASGREHQLALGGAARVEFLFKEIT